jgi:hypothetical protein
LDEKRPKKAVLLEKTFIRHITVLADSNYNNANFRRYVDTFLKHTISAELYKKILKIIEP